MKIKTRREVKLEKAIKKLQGELFARILSNQPALCQLVGEDARFSPDVLEEDTRIYQKLQLILDI